MEICLQRTHPKIVNHFDDLLKFLRNVDGDILVEAWTQRTEARQWRKVVDSFFKLNNHTEYYFCADQCHFFLY